MSWAITGVVNIINRMPKVRRWLSIKIARKIVNEIGDQTMGFGTGPSKPMPSIKEQMAESITNSILNALRSTLDKLDMSSPDKNYIIRFMGDVIFSYIMDEMEFADLWKVLDASFHATTKIRQYKPAIRDRFTSLLAPIINHALQDRQLVKIIAKELVKLLKQNKRGRGLEVNEREELRDAYMELFSQMGLQDSSINSILVSELNSL